MKPETVRRMLIAAAVLLPAAMLIALTWWWTLGFVGQQRQAAMRRAHATAASTALALADVAGEQVAQVDQILHSLAAAWQADPAHFDLRSWRDRTASPHRELTGDVLLIDARGRVVQATEPAMVGSDMAQRAWFIRARGNLDQPDLPTLDQPATNAVGAWYIPDTLRLRGKDHGFAGVIEANYRLQPIQALFDDTDIGAHGMLELVDQENGILNALAGAQIGNPGASIGHSVMFSVLHANPHAVWSGPSPDQVERLHAFRTVPNSNMVVVVGLAREDTLAPVLAARSLGRRLASGATALILLVAALAFTGGELFLWQRRVFTRERRLLATANIQLDRARSRADAKAAQLEATLAGMSDGVALIDKHLHLLQWNHRFPEIAGIPAGMLRTGLPMAEILRAQALAGQFGKVDVEAEVARRIAALQDTDPTGTVVRERPDGHTIELRRDRLADGSFVTLYQDVTARKRAEAALKEARALAEAAADAKSRFVAIVSHEIRSPLGALLNTLRLLGDSNLHPSQQVLLRMAHQSGDALLGLINDILDMASIEAGQLTLRPSVFLLNPLLSGVVEMFQAQAADRGIRLRLDADPEVPGEIYADPGRLRQVLINLMSNAVKFGLPGEVILQARRVRDQVNQPLLRLAVRDRGPLIEPEGRARLFRPFSRLDIAGGEEPIGSGLGLAICRHLVTLMGGDISCDPWWAPDGTPGNEFWTRLPLAPIPTGSRSTAAASEELPNLPRTRVLLVEDILANQLITATLLRRQGHLVDIAEDGDAAIQAVARQAYDIVFMDIYMPGKSGLEVSRLIRALPGAAGAVPIIALTASTAADDRLACQRAGMTDMVGKPAALPELLATMARHAWRGLPPRPIALRPSRELAAAPVLATERLEELRHLLPPDSLNSMVEECLADLQARVPALQRALQAGATEDATAHAHAMIGMAAGYGMTALEARLRALMQAARNGNRSAAGVLLDQLDTDMSRAANALREALQIELV